MPSARCRLFIAAALVALTGVLWDVHFGRGLWHPLVVHIAGDPMREIAECHPGLAAMEMRSVSLIAQRSGLLVPPLVRVSSPNPDDRRRSPALSITDLDRDINIPGKAASIGRIAIGDEAISSSGATAAR